MLTQINLESVDTTGFYDEIGAEIGHHWTLYKELLGAIRWAYRENRPSATLHLKKKTEAESQALLQFSQKLYDTTLIAKCFYDRNKKTLSLSLQTARGTRNFFDGGWLEWHALMLVLDNCQKCQKTFSCARNLDIILGDNEKYELDVFALVNDQAVCIECKSGEFRPYIEKLQKLSKKLNIDSQHSIMCVAGMPEDNLSGLSSMHKLTFANESTLANHLKSLFGLHS